jgi:N-acetylglucosamine-6-phosphate deacetylase
VTQVIGNARIFTGEELLENHALVIEGQAISALLPQSDLPADLSLTLDLDGGLIVPGFIDLQVNGGGGVFFNDAPTVDSIRTIGQAHRQYGTTGFLPTLITSSYQTMRQAIAAVDQAISEGVPGVLGIHLEGPFLNAERKGVHDASKFCAIDEEGLEIIASLQSGRTLLTIAPELTTPETIKRIVESGVIVAAGHSAANYQQTREALDAGVAGFTHLYNAMPPMQSREPGMVGAALEDENSWFGIIADGHHSHPASFRAAVRSKYRGGALLVTDAMSTVGSSDKSFVLGGETIEAVNGRCATAGGVLAGSDLDMLSAVNNAAEFASIDWFEAARMASCYPARALGMDQQLGMIRPGYTANMLALDSNRRITHSWINGINTT